MNNTLAFTLDNKKYISKPFDFEACCIVGDNCTMGSKNILRICTDAVDYMFDGTEATEDILKKLDYHKRITMCKTVWELYNEAFSQIKNA